MIRSQRRGGAPQPIRVPLPRGTTARPCSAAAASSALASSVPDGAATQPGTTPATASRGPAGWTVRQALASAAGTEIVLFI